MSDNQKIRRRLRCPQAFLMLTEIVDASVVHGELVFPVTRNCLIVSEMLVCPAWRGRQDKSVSSSVSM